MVRQLTQFEVGATDFFTGKWGFLELVDYIETYNEELQKRGGSVPAVVPTVAELAFVVEIHLHQQHYMEFTLSHVLSHI